jgi:heme-degrading monooxygenase HmoA
MAFISITRLRLRSWRFMPGFLVHAMRSSAQVRRAEGFVRGSLLGDRARTYWTMTLWRSEADMRRYMTTGDHRSAMPKLLGWCDEASVVHWEQEDQALPTWEAADARMRAEGRPSRVRHPTHEHGALAYRPPRVTRAVAIATR